jgi:hypothetical protein
MAAIAAGLPWEELRPGLLETAMHERRGRALRMLLSALELARLRAPLVLRPLRPANRPEARLKGAAALAVRFAPEGILASLRPLMLDAAAGRPARLIAALTVKDAVGRPRAIEVLTNAVLPLASAAGEEATAEAVYRRLAMPARYGSVKHIHRALANRLPLSARRQQGMLYLLKQACTQGGCGRCPLS